MSAPTLHAGQGRSRPGATQWQAVGRLQARYPVFQLVILGIVFAYGAASLPGFASLASIKSILIIAALVGLASAGETLVVLLGGFDLSISGFIVAGAAVVTQLDPSYGIPFAVGVLILIVAAGLLGGVSGWICHRYNIPSLIVTLAMGSIALGICEVQTGGEVAGSAPGWLGTFTSPIGTTFGIGIPPLIVVWVLVAIVLGVVLHKSAPGRRLYATGANLRAAGLTLVHTRRMWTLVFAVSAICSVLTGVLVGGFAGSVDSSVGDPYLFESLAAVIVGGTAFGGPGDYSRTVVGTLTLTLLSTVLIGHGLSDAGQQVMYAVIIMLAVGVYGRDRRIRDRV